MGNRGSKSLPYIIKNYKSVKDQRVDGYASILLNSLSILVRYTPIAAERRRYVRSCDLR